MHYFLGGVLEFGSQQEIFEV
jgi:hypothetical protein